MPMKPLRIYAIVFFLLSFVCCSKTLLAQNIIGMKIMIAENAPAFIAFPSEVENARWDNNEMNDYFKFSTRNENTIQISYNGKADPPSAGTGFSIIQGKNTHIFTLVFKKDYDINKDPYLFYDFDDKSKLKAAAEKSKKNNTGNDEPALASNDKEKAKEEKAEKEQQQREEEARKKEMSLVQQNKKKEIEAQQKKETEANKKAEQEREQEIAKAREEAAQREAEQKKARQEQEAITKANAEAERKRSEEKIRLEKEKQAEEKMLAREAEREKEKEKQEKDRAKAERDRVARETAEKKRKEEQQEKERIAIERQEREEADRKQHEIKAKEEAEAKRIAKEEAEAKLLALQREKEEAKKNARYTLAGLWERYGQKGINLYEIPYDQHNYNNTDFYVAQDTFENARNSEQFLAEPARLGITSETKKQVTLTLESISFKGPIAYYRVQVKNNSTDDYLVGTNKLAWYTPEGKARLFLKCSYLTDIGFFPLVKPGESKSYIYATRAANINNEDHLVLYVNERRQELPSFEISFDGSVYLKELSRVQKPISNTEKQEDTPTENKKGQKKKAKRD